MYSYIYDEFLQDSKFERDVANIETRLTDLGIMGKITRLALFRNAVEVMRDEIDEGVTTLVAVGNDKTLRRAIEAVGDSRTVVGYIPVGSADHTLAGLFGIPGGVQACDVLSARLVEHIDAGEVNGRTFLHAVRTEPVHGVVARCEDSYTVTPLRKASWEIRNFAEADDVGIVSPTDGRLSLIIRSSRFALFSRKQDVSVIPFREAHISASQPITMLLDNEKIQDTAFDIRVVPGLIRVVTGKGRKF